jgi:hypothetical protein
MSVIKAKSEDGIIIRYLWDDFIDCAMCGKEILYSQIGPNYGVPWYQGPCRSNFPDAGGKTVCKPCYDRWAEWDAK